jgi:uncharacterized phage-associated protein
MGPSQRKEEAMNIQDAADYIILKLSDAGEHINLLKLQKLAYYSEAWYLAIEKKPLTGSEFQAWIHGPVSRELYDRFKDVKSLYSAATRDDIRDGFDPERLDVEERAHIDRVLEVYAPFTGSQLESMTHDELPWKEARQGYGATERCEVVIKAETMRDYYGERLSK